MMDTLRRRRPPQHDLFLSIPETRDRQVKEQVEKRVNLVITTKTTEQIPTLITSMSERLETRDVSMNSPDTSMVLGSESGDIVKQIEEFIRNPVTKEETERDGARDLNWWNPVSRSLSPNKSNASSQSFHSMEGPVRGRGDK